MKEITNRQKEVLDFISAFIKENGYPPTVREIGEHFKISLRAVQDHIAALQKKGFLSQSQKRARSISVIDGDQPKAECCCIKVPFLCAVVPGKSLLSKENIDKFISIPEPFVKQGKSYFAIRVIGMSMKDAGIVEGDTAIVEIAETAADGQIVVAVIDGAIALRRFYKESDGVRLQAENPDFKPIVGNDVQIVGILSSLLRAY